MSKAFTTLEQHGDVPERIVSAFRTTWQRLSASGTWWTGAEQVALAAIARAAFAERFAAPWMRTRTDELVATVELPGDSTSKASTSKASTPNKVAEVMVRLSADAKTIDRAFAEEAIARIGDAAYVEMVAIAATVAAIDAFAEAIGVAPEPLPSPLPPEQGGEPSRTRPDNMGDIGAYVPMLVPFSDANVGRALTLCPTGNRLYRDVGGTLYHEGQFYDLSWDRPISRPQAEILATRVSAANECFY